MAKLYTNSRGNDVTRHSYSSGVTWDKCKRLYQLEKISGYRRKDKSAALAFGRALEDSVQFYHTNDCKPESGSDEFYRIWLKHKENTELVFTGKERDWANLRDCGVQLLKLYEIMLPSLPIKDPIWQISYNKEVFPGTTLAGLEMGGFVDLVSKSDWVHPMLPKVTIPSGSAYRPILIDLKTSGVELNINPAFLALDPQLAAYAWLSGINDVGFLWFVKGIADAFQKGTEVTFLEDSGKWTKGLRAVIHEYDSETQKALVVAHHDVERVKAALSEIKGKGATERKMSLITSYIIDGTLTEVPIEAVTKLKIQFLATRIAADDIKEAGEVIAKQIVEIHDASQTGFYPKSGGVRFPNNHCTYCSHRGICLGDKGLQDALLVQIDVPEEDDWLDELEDSE